MVINYFENFLVSDFQNEIQDEISFPNSDRIEMECLLRLHLDGWISFWDEFEWHDLICRMNLGQSFENHPSSTPTITKNEWLEF